ncbi:cbb3-type cytochrome c oxidase subunit 3 [Pseudooceanicola sp.]|uniref:cbb3-type cytochrome c oxidase subunit 3 n=1 Tax=Pseudooceanicola sp. TaxID=1914328 RepID=UPI0026222700|nr:cbb3-type cytochrome c oxidase subunit 3 [Pseudooceanicola sp.]MDF1856691.1 cbb3-type cytochrome c oxidase subunit 3 [Pseudooceanicola sp.]
MDFYSLLREFADSWMLLVLFGFFVGVIFWVFRPGSRKTYADTAMIPFRNEQAPAPADANATKEA